MIVKVAFSADHVMMFGNSYKPWKTQFEEYVWLNKETLPEQALFVDTSAEKWIGWGGLKWCSEEDFQHQLNREGCQDKDPDNPNARQYAQMQFKYNTIVENQVNKILREVKASKTT